MCSRILKQLRVLKQLFFKTKRNPNRKNIHQLRVALKSWRAFCDFTDNYLHLPTTKPLFATEFRNIFSALGKYREIQVQLKMCTKGNTSFLPPEKFIVYCKKRKKKFYLRINKAFCKAVNFSFRTYQKKVLQRITPYSKDLTFKAVELFFRRHLMQVFSSQSGKIYSLHLKRKRLKQLTLLYEVLQNQNLKKKISPIAPRLVALEKFLGQWHDTFVLKFRFQKFMRNVPKYRSEKLSSQFKNEMIQREHVQRIASENAIHRLYPNAQKAIHALT
jgi:CHAD domain-containing protein